MKRTIYQVNTDDATSTTAVIHHGEVRCMHITCPNLAYWVVSNARVPLYLCGVHSKKLARKALPKFTAREKEQQTSARAALCQAHVRDAIDGRYVIIAPGSLRCVRITGRGRTYPLGTGNNINIFPNFYMGSRNDGIGMPSLSPMSLGPVLHGEPGVPVARNIENYHQFSKVWPSEVDPNHGGPLPIWYTRRDAGFTDPEPHRHKFDAEQMKKERLASEALGMQNQNAPAYAVHLSSTGAVMRFTYVESRYFYCVAYEKLASQTPEFAQLCDWRDTKGVGLTIYGYDGYDLGVDADADALYRAYCDPTLPFGHERVLYAMLALHGTPNEYPWQRYYRDHSDVYVNACHM